MASVEIYTTPYCPYCHAAKDLLSEKGVSFTEIDVSDSPGERQRIEQASGQSTVPQIFIAGRPIGGYDDMMALEREGALDRLLEAS